MGILDVLIPHTKANACFQFSNPNTCHVTVDWNPRYGPRTTDEQIVFFGQFWGKVLFNFANAAPAFQLAKDIARHVSVLPAGGLASNQLDKPCNVAWTRVCGAVPRIRRKRVHDRN